MGLYRSSAYALTIRRNVRHLLIVRWMSGLSALILTVTSVTGIFIARQNPDTANAYAVPAITNVSSSSGPLAGGNTVTINGTGFGSIDGKNFSQISSGSHHTCGISNKKAYCWGSNDNGELGNGTIAPSNTPVAVRANSGDLLYNKSITQIEAGEAQSCALTSEGKVYCWGNNVMGGLGDGTAWNSALPVAVNTSGVLSGKTITQIAVGATFACALSNEKKIYCWGESTSGQLGNGETDHSESPVAVSTSGVLSHPVTQITAGYAHACAVTDEAKAYCWGSNYEGELGNNGTTGSNPLYNSTLYSTPQAVRANSGDQLYGKTVTRMNAGSSITCAITSEGGGKAYCWGANDSGQLGNGTITPSTTPVAVRANSGDQLYNKAVTQISVGMSNVCATTSESKAYCWGDNYDGLIGDGTTVQQRTTPVAVRANSGDQLYNKTVTRLSIGQHSCALTNEGKAYCWGYNDSGQLGDGTLTDKNLPTPVVQTNLPTSPPPTVLFDTTAATNVTLVSTTKLTVTVPARATAGTVDVSLTNYSNETTVLPNAYTYEAPAVAPTLTSVSPAKGTAAGGTIITLSGTNFSVGASVTIGGAAATDVTVVSDTTIQATTPSHSAGVTDITVTNPDTQSTTLANAYTYATSPAYPTNLATTPNNDGVILTWTTPSNTGGDAITDYKVEYSSDEGASWQVFNHTASTATTQTVTGLTPNITYRFRVSAINGIGTSMPSATVEGSILSITISAPSTVSMAVYPYGSTTVSSTSTNVRVTTNNPDGYNLYLETATPNRDLLSGDNHISPVSGTLLNPTSIAINTWGFRVDGIGNFDNGPTIPENNASSSGFSWAGIPEHGSPALIHSTTTAATDEQTTVWYAMRVTNTQPAGTYSNTVLYTAVAG